MGYVDFALSLSAGVSFQSGLLWGSMFLALVEILVEDSMVILFLGCGRVVSFWHCINFLRNLSSVSATSSYADDVAHT